MNNNDNKKSTPFYRGWQRVKDYWNRILNSKQIKGSVGAQQSATMHTSAHGDQWRRNHNDKK